MAAIHRRVYDAQGPALLFEDIKGSPFPSVSNLFGTLDRSRFMFRDTLEKIKVLVDVKSDPMQVAKNPFRYVHVAATALSALPWKTKRRAPILHGTTRISQLPQIVNWPMDGGPFVTMPQVYTEDEIGSASCRGKSVSVRVDLGGSRIIKKKKNDSSTVDRQNIK